MNDRSRETVEGMPLLYLEGHEPRTTDTTGLRRRLVPGRTAHRRPTIGGSADTGSTPTTSKRWRGPIRKRSTITKLRS
jgi:hypothetical protein